VQGVGGGGHWDGHPDLREVGLVAIAVFAVSAMTATEPINDGKLDKREEDEDETSHHPQINRFYVGHSGKKGKYNTCKSAALQLFNYCCLK
jgi:hypothetical protein